MNAKELLCVEEPTPLQSKSPTPVLIQPEKTSSLNVKDEPNPVSIPRHNSLFRKPNNQRAFSSEAPSIPVISVTDENTWEDQASVDGTKNKSPRNSVFGPNEDRMRSVLVQWRSIATRRAETDRGRVGPAPDGELGNKRKRLNARFSPATLDSDVEDLVEDSDRSGMSLASSRGLILYFAKLALADDQSDSVDLDFVSSLLKGGANINFTDKHGQTILHEVARAWHIDVAKFALKNGADINKGDAYGRTPLHVAASVGYPEMIEFLIANGAEINCRTKVEYQTPFHYSAKYNMIQSMRTLLKYNLDINQRDYKNRTPLYVAAESGRSEAARFLLEMGAPSAVYDLRGNSCLSIMVEKMPAIAKIALDQFHMFDRAMRKRYYYLNYLEKQSYGRDPNEHTGGKRAPQSLDASSKYESKSVLALTGLKKTAFGSEKSKSRQNLDRYQVEDTAKSALEVIVEYNELDLIMHPAIQCLLGVKWRHFGKWSLVKQVVINVLYTVLWTALGIMLPRDNSYYRPLVKNTWRVFMEVIGVGATVYFVVQQILNARMIETTDGIYKEWRIQQLRGDMEFCHPRWPDEQRYLKGELERIQRNRRGKYYRSMWNIYELVCHAFLIAVIISRMVAVLTGSMLAHHFHIRVFAITLVVIWMRMLKSFRSFRSLGPFVTLLGHVIKDTFKFAFLYMEFFIPYVCAFWIVFGGSENATVMESNGLSSSGWNRFNDLVYSVFEITVVTRYPWDSLVVVDRIFAQVLVGTFLALTSIICLNLYIALLSDTFSRVYENAKANSVMEQARQVLSVENNLSKKGLDTYKNYLISDCSPLEVYCEADDWTVEQNETADIIHHVNRAADSIKENIKELQKNISEVTAATRLLGNNLKPPQSSEELLAAMQRMREQHSQQMRHILDSLHSLHTQQRRLAQAVVSQSGSLDEPAPPAANTSRPESRSFDTEEPPTGLPPSNLSILTRKGSSN